MKISIIMSVLLLSTFGLVAYESGWEPDPNSIVLFEDAPDAIVIENLSEEDLTVAMQWRETRSRRFGKVDPWRDGEHSDECDLRAHKKLFLDCRRNLSLQILFGQDGFVRRKERVTADELQMGNCVQVLSNETRVFRRGIKPIPSLVALCLKALPENDRKTTETWDKESFSFLE